MLQLGSAKAEPGHKAWGQLRVREGRKQVRLAVCAINGAKPGHHFVLIANQHGVELNGEEAVRSFCEEVDPRKLKGTILAFPSMNPRAAQLGRQTWDEGDPESADEYENPYNMNRNWPGRKGGLLVQRVVHEVWTRAIVCPGRRASLVVDLHCHQHPSAVYAHDTRAAELGLVTGLPNIVITGSSGAVPTCNSMCDREGITCVTMELCRQQVFRHESITQGQQALVNLLRSCGALPGRLKLPKEAKILDPWRCQRSEAAKPRTSYIEGKAKHAGVVVPYRENYDLVRKGDLLCEVIDVHKSQVVEQAHASMSGALYFVRTHQPPCRKGDRLYLVSVVKCVNPRKRVGGVRAAAR